MIEQLFERLFNQMFKSANYKATVISVDKVSNTCIVKDLEASVERKAKIAVVEEGNQSQLVIYPKVGSVVICGSLYNNEAQAYICQVHEVDEILWKNGDQGGILKPALFLEQLSKTNDAVAAILQAFSSWVPVPEDGGAALKSAASSLGAKEVGDFSNVQDETFKV